MCCDKCRVIKNYSLPTYNGQSSHFVLTSPELPRRNVSAGPIKSGEMMKLGFPKLDRKQNEPGDEEGDVVI